MVVCICNSNYAGKKDCILRLAQGKNLQDPT
jgi:hypothetical protein